MMKKIFKKVVDTVVMVDHMIEVHHQATELYNMSDRELADIGLSRSDVSHVIKNNLLGR